VVNCLTQISMARRGAISPAMQTVARKEGLGAVFVRDEVARGRMVIPANIRHASLDPVGIGIYATCKVNANIGRSPERSDDAVELEKLRACIEYGADAVMDLSVGEGTDELRRKMIEACTAPLGTVPVYQAATGVEEIGQIEPDDFIQAIAQQAEQGVDFMTVHCGLLRRMLPLACKRKMGIVSRGGAIVARWMAERNAENPYFARFDDLLEICRQYDVTLSLGDGLRPGCLADASDEAQFAELDILGELAQWCWDANVQVMIEGPGHVPLDQIPMNVERQMKVCKEAPFYVLGPVVCDIAPGYDHISGAIGSAVAAMAGAAMLCYVTPKEHLGLPDIEDVRAGIIASRIAAHAADVARHRPGARDRDDAMSDARMKFDWEQQFALSLDSRRAREYFLQHNPQGVAGRHHCSMCGEQFCAVRASAELKERVK